MSSDSPPPLAYFNGRYLPLDEARLPVWDRGVVQGATVTEMVRTFHHRPFLLERHLRRLEQSVAALGVTTPESTAEIAQIVEQLLSRNSHLIAPTDEWGIICFVTAGIWHTFAPANVQDRPSLCVHLFPLPESQWRPKYQTGQRLAIPATRHIPPEIIDPHIKYRSRLHWYLAEAQARDIDPQASALLLDLHGRVTETNSGNFCIVRDGEILTPPAELVLSGVSQEYVTELATGLGRVVRSVELTRADALRADEAFVTSSSYCILPVTSIDGHQITTGKPGPVTTQLLESWEAQVRLKFRTAT